MASEAVARGKRGGWGGCGSCRLIMAMADGMIYEVGDLFYLKVIKLERGTGQWRTSGSGEAISGEMLVFVCDCWSNCELCKDFSVI